MKALRLVPAVILTIALLAAPRGAPAQQPGKVYRIGYLGLTNPVTARPGVDAFRKGLRERGWIEGQNLVIEFRWAEGKPDRLPALAAELAALKVDAILAAADLPSRAARDATTTIPIVMQGVADPVATGLAPSLARPSGNLTGITWDPTPEVWGKALELLRETVPTASRVARLGGNPDSPYAAPYLTVLRAAAVRLGVALQLVELRRADQLDAAFDEIVRHRAGAVLVASTAISVSERVSLAALALQHRLPTMFDMLENVEAGGLMFYGVKGTYRAERGAYYVDRILRGARPADLPIEQPSKIELVINLRTARALGLTFPPSVLIRADAVIQ